MPNEFRVVRSFSENHYKQFFELYDREWPNETRTHDDLRRAIDGSDFVIGVQDEASGDLVGVCRVDAAGGFRAWIHGLVVREDFRSQGLGRQIMDQVLESEALPGVHSLRLTCAAKMHPFYRKWGFRVVEGETVMNLNLR